MFAYIQTYFIILLSNFIRLKFSKKAISFFTFIVMLYFIIFIGLRHQVGGDWKAYLSHYENLEFNGILFNLLSWDPGYVLLEYISKISNFGIYGVNVLCAILFLYGFLYFLKSFKIPISFALLIAFPYLIMVVVNGYSRQGVAIGFTMAMIGGFYSQKLLKSIVFFILAIMFHKTAIVTGIIYLFQKRISFKRKFFLYIVFILIAALAYLIFQKQFEVFLTYYFLNAMQSSGGLIRIMTNVLASTLLFIFAKRYKKYFDDFILWKWIGLLSIFILFFTLLTNATTIGDRILLYFYPLQIVVFYRILLLIRDKNLKYLYFFGIITLYLSMLVIWLNFAAHRFAWIPYDNLLFRILE